MGHYGDRGRPPSRNPKKNTVVFLLDDNALIVWNDFQKYVEKRKNFECKQDIFLFMIANSYKILG